MEAASPVGWRMDERSKVKEAKEAHSRSMNFTRHNYDTTISRSNGWNGWAQTTNLLQHSVVSEVFMYASQFDLG